MNAFQQKALQLAESKRPLPWLQTAQETALKSWLDLPWPTKKTEAWMYTNLTALQKQEGFSWAGASHFFADDADLLPVDAIRLVFVNGVFNAEASSELPDYVVQFSKASAEQIALIQQYLGSVTALGQQWFSQLNTAWLSDGIFVHVKANSQLDKPVYIVQVADANEKVFAINQRLLVLLEKNSRAQVIEHFISAAQAPAHFTNAVTEILVQDNAEVSHYNLHLEEEQQQHIGSVHLDLSRNARFRGFTLSLGTQLTRIDYQCHHRGEGAEMDLQGVYLPTHQQLVDYHTCVEHWVPRCVSNEVFRGIISDQAQAVFNGRIHIHPQAQKTSAELSNKNLLTSNQAQINTKPELEIYADDVKCAHGATVSQLNANALYYLKSRGVAEAEARVMMSFGFINELLQAIQEPGVRDYLTPRLAKRFGRDPAMDLVE
jgi:Fe-S cluster assembly protein SufD